MDLGIHGKVAIVGGASKGLGKASAQALAQEGVNLMLASRNSELLSQTALEIHAYSGVQVNVYPGDLARPEVINNLVQATVDTYGRLDIVVSNIGGPPPGGVELLDEDMWAIAIQQTYLFFIRMAQAALPHMKSQRWGRIISILSTAVKQPNDNLVLSTSARLGAAGFLKALSTSVASHNVTVNNVLPGPFLTERQYELAQREAESLGSNLETVLEKNARANPMGRMGNPQELGALVAYLASEKASYITGASIPVDGGGLKTIL